MANQMQPLSRLIAVLAALLFGSTAQAATAQQCVYQGGASLDISLTGRGLKPTVQGKINGVSVPMLIDTGAYRSFLTARFVQKLGISTQMTSMTVEGIGGEQSIRSAHVKEFTIGGAPPIKSYFLVMGEYANETPYAVILGADFLLQADLMVDIGQRFMQFFYPNNCSANAVLFPEATILEADWHDYDRRMHFTVKVNGVPMRTLIDTGASYSIIDQRAAKKAGITPAMPNVRPKEPTSGVGGEGVAAWFVPVAKLEIGNEVQSDIMLEMADIGSPYGENRSDIILGTDFLSSYTVLFARSQKKVYLIKNAPLKLVGSDADWAAINEAHAAAGNPGAMSHLAELLYEGKGVAKDEGRAAKLFADAAAKGDLTAQMQLAFEDLATGNYAKAAASMSLLSAEPGASRKTDLLSFLASSHNGEQEKAKQDLKMVRQHAKGKRWPLPVIDYLLNDADEKDLLRLARKQELSARSRECEAHYFIGHVNWLRGDTGAARKSFDSALGICEPGQYELRASEAALRQLEGFGAKAALP